MPAMPLTEMSPATDQKDASDRGEPDPCGLVLHWACQTAANLIAMRPSAASF
jgi:hypothetical protein